MHHGAITLYSNAPHHSYLYTTPKSIHHHPYTTPIDHYTTWHHMTIPYTTVHPPSIHHLSIHCASMVMHHTLHAPPHCTLIHHTASAWWSRFSLMRALPHRSKLVKIDTVNWKRHCRLSPWGDHWLILIVDQRTCSSSETTSALFRALY